MGGGVSGVIDWGFGGLGVGGYIGHTVLLKSMYFPFTNLECSIF